jgi:hypothetical protein
VQHDGRTLWSAARRGCQGDCRDRADRRHANEDLLTYVPPHSPSRPPGAPPSIAEHLPTNDLPVSNRREMRHVGDHLDPASLPVATKRRKTRTRSLPTSRTLSTSFASIEENFLGRSQVRVPVSREIARQLVRLHHLDLGVDERAAGTARSGRRGRTRRWTSSRFCCEATTADRSASGRGVRQRRTRHGERIPGDRLWSCERVRRNEDRFAPG